MDINLDSNLEDSKELHDILFNRPVGVYGRPSVSILLGRHVKLSELSRYYEVLDAFDINPIIISDHSLASVIPGSITLKSRDTLHYQNSDEAVEAITNTKALIILTGSEINTSLSLFVEQLSKVYTGFVVLDSIKLLKLDWNNRSTLCVGDYSKLISKGKPVTHKALGLKQKAEELLDLSAEYDSAIVAISSNQALGIYKKSADELGVINAKEAINAPALTAIITALLSERDEPIGAGWMSYVLVSGYLYRKYFINGGAKVLKRFLNSQF